MLCLEEPNHSTSSSVEKRPKKVGKGSEKSKNDFESETPSVVGILKYG